MFNRPTGIVYVSVNELLVSDTQNYRVRRISYDFIRSIWRVDTVAGNGTSGMLDAQIGTNALLNYPTFMLFINQTVYFADNVALRCIQLNTFSVATVCGAADGMVSESGSCSSMRFQGLYCVLYELMQQLVLLYLPL